MLRQLTSSLGIFFRTARAFFTRKLVGAWSYLRRITNFSRQATKAATTSFQGAAAAVKKPTKREDYIETQRLFISKSFLILLAAGLILTGLLVYFLIWPFLLSKFFTARYYQGNDKLDDWSGRVIVYYDEDKKIPMYRGTLEDGLLQGLGEAYDEEGLLVYEGNFVDGVRSGDGTLYENGVLVYDGQFSGGLPNGMGTAYADGVRCYQGAFVDGLYEGNGTTYHANGARAYVGMFAAGLYEGEGTLYDDDGQMTYKGSFAEGLYSGSGTVYLKDGSQIRAEFAAGVTTGTIQWYQNGRLWYDGGADNLTPDGFGTLYAENGKAVYAGEFDQGTLDGAWLMSLTSEGLREAFAEADIVESEASGGFLVYHETIGLTALCSYQQETADSQVYQLWFAPEAGSLWTSLLPWENGRQAGSWAVQNREETVLQETVRQGGMLQPDGTESGSWYQRQYQYGDYVCTLLSESMESAPVQICWSREMPEIEEIPVDPQTTAAQERLESLLAALDGAGALTASGGGSEESLGNVERLLGLVLTAQDGEALMDALIDVCTYGEMASCLEASQPLLQQELADAQSRLQRGTGTQQEVDEAQTALDSLDQRLAQYRTAQEQAGLTVEELSKLDASDYDLAPVLISFDPADLDLSALYEAALVYAQATAGTEQEVDGAALERELKSAVLELGLSYESIRTARTAAEAAAVQVTQAEQSYARGMATRQDLYGAQCARDEAAAALYQAVGTFAHQVNGLNVLSGGWVSETYDWMADTFDALFRAEILRAETAAQEAEEERAQREQEAAEAIRQESSGTVSGNGEAPEDAADGMEPQDAAQPSGGTGTPDGGEADGTVDETAGTAAG